MRKLRKRAIRERRREFVVEGVLGLEEAMRAGADIREIWVTSPTPKPVVSLLEGAGGVEIREVSGEVMRSVSATESPQGVLAVADFCDVTAEEILSNDPSLLVILAGVRDPGNAGTIHRTAWAAGADALITSEGTVDPYNPKVVRSSAGALFNVPLARNVDVAWMLERLGEVGMTRIAADPAGSEAYYDVDMGGRIALIFGNEAWGVPEDLAERADARASIPMQGAADSLNVAVAAALFLFEARRQRRDR